MCLKAKTVNLSSRSHYYNLGFGNLCDVTVPCGRCPECIDAFRNDFFIRFKSEYDDCVSKGGSVVFLTWTYSDTNVPAYTYRIEDQDIVFDKVLVNTKDLNFTPYIFAFDKYHLQKFFNSFRKKFERLGITSPMRYAVVGEYGTDGRYTQRPHFHGLIFLSKEVTKYYVDRGFGDFSERLFMIDVDTYWPYGMVSKSKDHGLLVNSDDAIRYVSKYISKNILLSNLNRFKYFKSFICDHLEELNPVDFNYNKSVDSLFLYYLRKVGSSLFVMKSKGLGLTAITHLQNYLRHKDYDTFYKDFKKGFSYVKDGETKYLPYSFYYYRKLFYDIRVDGSFCLNQHGFHYLSLALYDKFISRYNSICDLNFNNLKGIPDVDYHIDFCKSIQENSVLLSSFCLYDCFVRFRSYPVTSLSFIHNLFDRFGSSNPPTIKEMVYIFVRLNYGYCFDDDIRFVESRHEDSLLSLINYNFKYSTAYFRSDFELFRTCVDKLVCRSRQLKREEQDRIYEMSKSVRDLANFSIYNRY